MTMSRIAEALRRPGLMAGVVLVAVFVAGALSGAAAARAFAPPEPARPLLLARAGAPDPARLAERMRRNLELTDAQVEQVRAVLERRQPQMRETWMEARGELLAQLDSTMREIGAVLTPEQRERWRERWAR